MPDRAARWLRRRVETHMRLLNGVSHLLEAGRVHCPRFLTGGDTRIALKLQRWLSLLIWEPRVFLGELLPLLKTL